MNNFKLSFYLLFLLLYPATAHAHGIPMEAVLVGLAIFIAPFVFGLMIVGQGNRLWFLIVSVITYGVCYASSYLEIGLSFLVALFFPYTLILVALYKRNRSKRAEA